MTTRAATIYINEWIDPLTRLTDQSSDDSALRVLRAVFLAVLRGDFLAGAGSSEGGGVSADGAGTSAAALSVASLCSIVAG